MSKYTSIQKEETLKASVFADFFGTDQYNYEPNIDNIDFIITEKQIRSDLFGDSVVNSKHYLWAESKKGTYDVESMLTQLLLTCKKTYEKATYLAPPWLGCFDIEKIAFVPFYDILPIFNENDINWNTTPSNHTAPDFQKARNKITKLVLANLVVYYFDTDEQEIREFVKIHFSGGLSTIKSPITKDNFIQIFIKWVKEVKPFINIAKDEWIEFKQKGILDCDFYRADMMSLDGNSITEKLKIILKNDNYKFQVIFGRRLFQTNIDFTDGGIAYKRFWNKYERPPVETYQTYITERRDLLVPENIRERKGSFFTPAVWVKKSQEYLAKAFGEQWQDEYYIWDCAAGTGNLLAGLSNEYNIWASDIDEGNVETIQSLIDIDENLNLLSGHVFQFDFLNDDFDKLPVELKKILDDPEKRKKLIIYINPPYAEADNRKGEGRTGVAVTKIHEKYAHLMGYTKREMYIQFLTRIYCEIPDAMLADFSKLKNLQAPKFVDFRAFFKAKLLKCFLVPANTFDNVKGEFPIAFKIWNTEQKEVFQQIKADVFEKNGNYLGEKTIYAYNNLQFINDWARTFRDTNSESIATIIGVSSDFQNQRLVRIEKPHMEVPADNHHWQITKDNLIESSIYLAVRHCIESTWINDRDQFLYPSDDWKNDIEFQNNCLIFTLFHGQNRISANSSINQWIPFTEKQVGAKEKFDSNFMTGFLKGKIFSAESRAVLDAGLDLWKYYHAKIKDNRTVPVNASFYDIREFFQGRNEKGAMKSISEDEIYNTLISALRENIKILTQKIQPKVYEYGFLKE
ncbi:hypothetical protein FACS1894172_01260 [Spirochaetia bacterium]|nr:hypothetical protein FACS1894172_01260 [Spirochaetia bacterium]